MTQPISRHAALASLALALAAPAVHADSGDSATAPAATVLVTASRSPQPLADVISDSVVIGAEQIAASGADSVVDLLQRQRGIEIARNGGAGTSASVFIRGANSNQNIVLVDGVRIGSSTTGAANWSAIPLSAIDHIEIVYGPLSSMYGADAVGGVIQIFTRTGKGAPTWTASAGYGSDNTRALDASVAGATAGEHRVSYAISASREKSDSFSATRQGSSAYNADRDGYDRTSVAAQLRFALAAGYEVGAVLLHSALDSQYDAGAGPYDVRSEAQLSNGAVFGRAQLTPRWTSMLQYAQSRDNSVNYSSAAASGYSRIDSRQRELSWQNDIVLGSDILQLLLDHREEEVSTNGADALNRQRSSNAVAASYNARRGAHLFSASARRDKSVYGANTTGALGYAYQLTPTLRASASYGSSFRAPTYNELYYPSYGNPANRPEQGRNAEIGVRYDDGVHALSASYYRNRLTDLLVNTTPCPFGLATYRYGCAYNVSRAQLEGLTVAGATRLLGVNLNASVDLQDPKDDTTRLRLARRSKRHASVNASYAVGPLEAGVELALSGDRFDDAANKNRLGGYGLVNLLATYSMARDWSLLVRWNNVGDKRYELARFYNTAGAKVFAGVRYGFR
ncbi:TonB-dependent receptor domain-containing protein [Massilia sp. PWRC2]|uniref:TonB-dependent receptor domain-containing protein n=1 Tax=Massilia sp. PWRC2 TaxID=2804626 RepID=UPI003CEBBEB8